MFGPGSVDAAGTGTANTAKLPFILSTRPADDAARHIVSVPVATGPLVQRLSQPQQKAVAGPVDPDRRVGAIFINDGPLHVCTGSVIHSAGGNLVMTKGDLFTAYQNTLQKG